jgi:pimeloyl-ACP methyl ester carboxylesterase/DNA-binding CsgD family transcriptional regulator
VSDHEGEPAIRFARTSDGLNIAFWTCGEGPVLVHMPGFPVSHIRMEWQHETSRGYYQRLSRGRSLLRYDSRGTGLSERMVSDFSIEGHLRDLEAVVEAAGIDRFALMGMAHLGPAAITYAARHPERLTHLILWFAYARASDYTRETRVEAGRSLVERDWGLYTELGGRSARELSDEDSARQYTAYLRESNTAMGTAAAFQAIAEYDVTELLPQVRCPTLVVHRRESRILSPDVARSLADAIPDSRLVFVDGTRLAPFVEDVEGLVTSVGRFLSEGLDKRSLDGLTPRELQVLRLIARGRSNREIAGDLALAERTVARHITNIYTKIGAHGKADATAYAFRHNLV